MLSSVREPNDPGVSDAPITATLREEVTAFGATGLPSPAAIPIGLGLDTMPQLDGSGGPAFTRLGRGQPGISIGGGARDSLESWMFSSRPPALSRARAMALPA